MHSLPLFAYSAIGLALLYMVTSFVYILRVFSKFTSTIWYKSIQAVMPILLGISYTGWSLQDEDHKREYIIGIPLVIIGVVITWKIWRDHLRKVRA
jgi:drug/metabolite transporter (DMT)-like permease